MESTSSAPIRVPLEFVKAGVYPFPQKSAVVQYYFAFERDEDLSFSVDFTLCRGPQRLEHLILRTSTLDAVGPGPEKINLAIGQVKFDTALSRGYESAEDGIVRGYLYAEHPAQSYTANLLRGTVADVKLISITYIADPRFDRSSPMMHKKAILEIAQSSFHGNLDQVLDTRDCVHELLVTVNIELIESGKNAE